MATDGPILLIGRGDLAGEVRQGLDALDAEVVRLVDPTTREVADVFERGPVAKAVVVSRDDAVAMRYALMVRHHDADVEMLLTLFDRTVAEQLSERIEPVEITSLADIVAPVLAGPCLDESLDALVVRGDRVLGVRADGERVVEEPVEVRSPSGGRLWLESALRPFDRSAALMFYGVVGLILVLVLETLGAVIVIDQKPVDAFYGSAKALVTVGPNDAISKGPPAFKVVIGALHLCALVFEAFFTAGIVNRLIDRRLTGLLGRRAVPRRDHVVVVGLGKVGMRLTALLRQAGAGVVAVDEQEDGENVGSAREQGLPVVVGRGADPSLLRRLSVTQARALAAVTDDDLQNVSIAMSALAINPDLRVILRVGDGRLANETRSLTRFGLVRDVHRIAAALIAAQATGSAAGRVVCGDDGEALLVHGDGRVEQAAMAAVS